MAKRYKILIVDDVHPALFEFPGIEGFFDFDYRPNILADEIEAECASADVLLIRSKRYLDKGFFAANPQLLLVARAGSGTDNIDLNHCHCEVINAAEGNSQSVAEHVLAMMLSLLNHLPSGDKDIRAGRWQREKHRGRELSECTIGIIGYGHVGSKLASLLRAFGAQVCVYDKYKQGFGVDGIRECSLDEVLSQADVLSIHVPLTEETRNMVDKGFIAKLKPGVVVINTARGEIVELAAFIDALASGHISKAGLDVLPIEKPVLWNDRPEFTTLMKMEQVILSPHVAGWTSASYRKISEVLAEKLVKWVNKQM
jgi:D-3-phosphoglycerate dehydrogenase